MTADRGLLLARPDEADEQDEQPGVEGGEGDDVEARALIEWPFKVGVVYTRDLFVDHRYQRPIQETFVARIADDFDPTLVGTIDVSSHEDDRSAILDGQQRFEGMNRRGITTCYAAIFEGLTLEDEAGFFFRKNKDRRSMAGFYGFRARLVAGDLEATQIDEAVREQGFELGEGTDHERRIGAIQAVEWAWGYSSEARNECLTPALRTIRESYFGQKSSLDSGTIAGFGRFWQGFADDEVDQATLVEALSSYTAANLLAQARERTSQIQATLPFAVADVVVNAYNRAKRGPSRAPSFPGRLDPSSVRPSR